MKKNIKQKLTLSYIQSLAKNFQFETQIRWTHVLFLSLIHLISLHAIYLIIKSKIKWQTLVFTFVLFQLCSLGLTAGVHRLWSHRSYKAKMPLRFFLMLCQTLSFQKSIIRWSRDHRIHHKYSETIKDPHNIHRGVFFAHVGWILLQKRPEVFDASKTISLDDLYSDSIVYYQHKFYLPLLLIFWLILPATIPFYVWKENYIYAFEVAVILRHVITLNFSFLINSYSHMIGLRKYDVKIKSTDNNSISFLTSGEGFHNYHHVFPNDYSTSELKYFFNLTTIFIDIMAWLGQAYDLKKKSSEAILARRLRTGDLSLLKNN